MQGGVDVRGEHDENIDYGYDSEDVDAHDVGNAGTWPSVVLLRGHTTKWRGLMGTYMLDDDGAYSLVNGAPVYSLVLARDSAFVHPDSGARDTEVVLFRRATPTTAGHLVGGGVAAGAAGVGHWTIGPAGDIAGQREKQGWLRTDAAHARRGVVGLLGTQWEFLSSAAFGTYTKDAGIDVNVFGEAGAGQVGAALAAAAAETKARSALAAAGGDESDARARVIFIEMGKSHTQAGRVYKLQCASMEDKAEWLVAFAQARRAQQLLADADEAMRITPEPAIVGALKLVDDVRSLSCLVARQHRVVHLWSEIGASALSIAAPVSWFIFETVTCVRILLTI